MTQDETKLRQCVTNFLSNAFKFTNNGLVTMDVTTMDKDGIEMIEFKVTDDGEGMSAEGVAKVFEEYEQAERSYFCNSWRNRFRITYFKKIC